MTYSLKCVLTEVMLFSIIAFKTLTFHKVVYSDTLEVWWYIHNTVSGGIMYIIILLY